MRGVLATTTSMSGKELPSFLRETISKVIDFFNNESYGRIIPGKKDVVSIKMGDKRELVQK